MEKYSIMNRRDFLQKTLVSSAIVSLGGLNQLCYAATNEQASTPNLNLKQLTILHTNDVHSYIDPFPATHPKNPNMGGVARRAALIEMIRKENSNLLVLDAGDIFQGTPYFNYFGGEIEFKLMSLMKYDLATIGNHDFDNGIDGLYKQLPNASFEFVNANYDLKNTLLDTHVKPYKIFVKDGIKVGVFGIGVELEGLVDKRNFKETKYLDPVEIAQDMSKILKIEKKCDLVICLSHIGYQYKNDVAKISDVKLAKLTKNIDLIIGGHTHTFLDKPTILMNVEDKEVIVNQVGCYGVQLGRIDFYFESNTSKKATGTSIAI
jgi:5'-nucleotidase